MIWRTPHLPITTSTTAIIGGLLIQEAVPFLLFTIAQQRWHLLITLDLAREVLLITTETWRKLYIPPAVPLWSTRRRYPPGHRLITMGIA